MSISSAFVWGNGGAQLTPEQIAKQREIEDALLQKGADTSPVGSVWEGLARVADAAAGSFRRGRLAKAEAENKAYDTAELAKLLNGGGGGSAFPPTPSATDNAFPPAPASLLPASGTQAAGFAPGAATSPQLAMASISPANDPVSDVLAAGAQPQSDQSWLKYSNQGATRNQPLDPKLTNALGFLPELGVSMEVFSGGQPEAGQGPRTGSVRHDHGDAADAFFYKDGKKLDWANPADRPVFEEIVRRGKAAGVTGFGAGDGYMQPGSMHLGFGAPAVWGAGGKGSNAPDWLRHAYAGQTGEPEAFASQPGMAATASPALSYAGPAPQQVAQAAPVPGQTATDGQDWLPAEFQNSPQLRNAYPTTGILAALTGQPGPSAPQPSAGGITAPNGAAIPPEIIKVLTDARVSEQTRGIAKLLLSQQQARQQAIMEQQLKQADPAYRLGLRKTQAELDNMEHPKMSPGDEARLKFDQDKFKTDQANRGTLTAAEQAQNERENAKLALEREKFDIEVKNGEWAELTDGRIFNKRTGDFRDAPPPVPGSIAPKPDDVSGLRKEIYQLPSYKNVASAMPIYKSMLDAAKRPTAASDLNMVYGIAKLMDPTSVVREGEVQMANDTQGIADRLNGMVQRLQGGAALQPEVRQQLLAEGYSRMQQYKTMFDTDAGMYRGIAGRMKMNVADIVPEFGELAAPQSLTGEQPQAVTTAPGAPQGQAPADPLAAARDAIARGADRNKVIQRLRQRGIVTEGL